MGLYKKSPIALIAAVLAVGLIATTHVEAATVRIGIVNSSSDAPMFIAEKKGYFQKEGIEAEFIHFDTAAKMIAPLGFGQLDVGGGGLSAGLYNAVSRGIGIKIVADKGSMPAAYGFFQLLVRKDLVDSGKVKTLKDLKGLKVGITAKGTTADALLNEALKKGGLKWGDAEVTTMGFAQQVLALQSRSIDASITPEPSATQAVQGGVAVRFGMGDVIYPEQQVAALLYGDKFIKEQPELAKKFMRAYIRAARDYNDALRDGKLSGPYAEEVIAILTEKTAIKDPNVYKSITPNGVNPDGKVFDASLKKDLQFFKDRKMIDGNITVEEVVDNSFVTAALKDLGPYRPRK
jgi:NitT/TauT family transport system substrate-binding protein